MAQLLVGVRSPRENVEGKMFFAIFPQIGNPEKFGNVVTFGKLEQVTQKTMLV